MSADGIFANLAFCIPIGIFMFLLFIYFRHTLPIFYHRNALCHGKPVLGMKAVLGSFNQWFRELMSIGDELLLRVAGLDALVTSNGCRLMLLFACIMAVPCLLLLIPYYYAYSDHSESVDFDTFTISDLYTDNFWPPLLVLILLTVLVLYGVYAFYANFLKMRQAYLLRPSALSSMGAILTNAEAFGSIKYARRRSDSATCTVLLNPVPADLGATPQALKESLEKSGITALESVQFIGDYGKVKMALLKRNSSLAKLESALKTVCDKLSKQNKNDTDNASLSVKERAELLVKLINDTSLCAEIRPRHKTSSPAKTDPEPVDAASTVDSLRHFYKKLQEREEDLQSQLESFNNPQSVDAITSTDSQPSDSQQSDLSAEFEKRYVEETTFISWNKVTDFSSNLQHASALASNQSALLHFSDYREASRAQQLLLTARSNAMGSRMAPTADDLNWPGVRWSEQERWYGALKSNICYWALVILFAPISTAIVALIDTSSLANWLPAVQAFREKYPQVRVVLESVVAPFLATLLVKRTGIWIMQIMRMRGPLSKSELMLKSQSGHLFFLFFQVIFIGAFFSNIYHLTAMTLASTTQETFIAYLRENVPKKAHFFFNFMIQDIFNEMMLELLNPKSLFFDRGFLSRSARKDKSVRELLQHDTSPPELEMAFVWSRFIMFPFFIFMTYVIIAPLIVLPAVGFFSVAYFVGRFRLAQFGRRAVETGGLYWRQCSQQVIYGLLMAQLSVLLQYTQFRKGLVPSLILLVLFTFSVLFIPFLKRHFGRSCDHLSILEDHVRDSKKVAQGLLHEQNEMIPSAVDCLETSEIIKSNLDSNLHDHFNFTDIDPKHEERHAAGHKIQEDPDVKALFDPYWSVIPLNLSIENSSTFDQFQVDALVDTTYVKKQYQHPLILEHSQVLIVPQALPHLLKTQ